MSDLAEFLLARIGEDEAVARAATPGPWYWEEPSKDSFPQSDESLLSSGKQDDGFDIAVLTGWGYDASGINGEQPDRDHIAQWHPARILAECKAKRRIVEHCTDWRANEWEVGPVLQLLALPYAGHKDFREEWKP